MVLRQRPSQGSRVHMAGARPENGRRRSVGVTAALAGSAANQSGAAAGALAFPAMGPVGVVAVRQLVTALVMVFVARPRFRSMTSTQVVAVMALAAVFGVMNLSLYLAVERIGLGLAVTLEFLGPLAVAVAGSRRALDVLCAGLAAVGVIALVGPSGTSDIAGVVAALVAAAGWAGYILLNQRVGALFSGFRGTSAAAILSAVVWAPVAVALFTVNPPSPRFVLLAALCGVLASVVPFAVDMVSLRHLDAGAFGTLASVNPVWAAVGGWIVLGQVLSPWQMLALVLIVAANVIVSTTR
ncbi:DMT family transporter [Rhodococcus sp. BP-241]|uniref:EamA family transporter n=1 Tax=Rhodococcus sp. BP-241 TaxID=2739441 RepID=UPI0021C08D72|nr:EamA family transporter [Rhodococcus sp. BP-241]